MPDLYIGIAVSNADCDALASHACNHLQSDCDGRCQGRRRHFPFVAEGGAGANWIRANADRSFGGDSRAVTALLHRLSARALARPSESQTVAAQGPPGEHPNDCRILGREQQDACTSGRLG